MSGHPIRYHLLLREAVRPGVPEPPVLMELDADAREMVDWLFSGALAVSEDDPPAREQFRRLVVAWLDGAARPAPAPPTEGA